ncbi:hypothetical protein B0J15DRAFT_552980 [Fusarium solani]|uniref:Bulb-type lectin domain-containing protein n=1 Tax=Fusarium solani TaxID=169388 RepID=A0A9P9GNQ2_FUSSL|nr:uncharacterized protein B0J15DRAFT_552980 [Fusarium solani]KAH7242943.1 hypothetical protein B0J15DRAFT_552980 [Fusarium solani]
MSQPSTPATPAVSDRLKAGSSLGVDGLIKSPNGDYAFVLQSDGNCCAYAPGGRPIWCSNTWGYPKPVTCILETDGNLRLLEKDGSEKWSSGSGGQGTADSELIIQDDGNVVISTDGKVFWSTNSTQAPLPTPADTPGNPSSPTTKPTMPPPAPAPTDRLNPGTALNINQTLVSTNGSYTLIMQPDHNCVMYQNGKGPLWSAGMAPGLPAQSLLFRADGELEILDTSGDPKWQAGTAGRGNSTSYFQVRDDGNMVIWTDNQIVWSSRTGPAYPMPVKNHIVGGQRILPGELLTSTNGNYTLTLGLDLNFVLAQGSTTTWSTGAGDTEGGGWVQVDTTGNMAVIASFQTQWSSHTTFRRTPGNCFLKLGNDGVVDLKLDDIIVWSTDASKVQTYVPPDFIAYTSGNILLPGQYLASGQSMTSPSGKMTVTLLDSNQFIIQNVPTKTTLFTSSPPPNLDTSMITIGYNNDLILWAENGRKIWEAPVNINLRDNIFANHVPGSLVLKDSGDLALHDINGGQTIWKSNTSCPAFSGTVSELNLGETLLIGQKMQSPNGVHEITFLASGGLQLSNTSLNTNVVYEPPLTSATANSFTFGRDKVLQISDASNNSLWRSSNRHPALNTTYAPPGPDGLPQLNGAPGLILDNDCNIFVRNGDGKILWKISDIIASIGNSLTPGVTLDKAHSISCAATSAGTYVARISSKGNLILLHKRPWDEFEPERLMWTAGATNADSAWMSSDGSLCVGSGGTATWTSNTGGHSGEDGIVLYVQPDGNMCIYVAGKPTFSTNTAH